jgi:Thioredoxin
MKPLWLLLLAMPTAGLLGCASGQGHSAATSGCLEPSRPSRASRPEEVCREPEIAPKTPGRPPAAEHRADVVLGMLPVTAQDPFWGSPEAPVTIVEFSDFQCPFCARTAETLQELRRIYGPARLRLVWKNSPLPYHDLARPVAEVAMTVFALGGAEAFWKFHDLVFANQQALSTENYVRWAVMAGVDRDKLESEQSARLRAAKVDEDVALAKKGSRALLARMIPGPNVRHRMTWSMQWPSVQAMPPQQSAAVVHD